jgi:hypothetical protein
MAWTPEAVEKVLDQVRRRAVSDPAFREKALSDPRAAVAEFTPEGIPQEFRLRFVDNEGAHMTVVLPDPTPVEGALSEHELELVAGGMGKGSLSLLNKSQLQIQGLSGSMIMP